MSGINTSTRLKYYRKIFLFPNICTHTPQEKTQIEEGGVSSQQDKKREIKVIFCGKTLRRSGEVGRYDRRERKVETSFPKYQ